jgi:hypothetical protein
MADRRDYYFRQKVTEAELDAGFNELEQADWNITVDNEFIGVVNGMVVTEKSGTPDLSVDVSGGTTYSKQGERVYFASTQNVDVSQDDGGTPTTVTTPGNTRVVSVFVIFDRALSDPRIDGNGLTVYFVRDESFDFSVVQGAEAVIGSEVAPPIAANKILLADIRLEFGTTQVLNSATVGAFDQIEDNRREDAFSFTGGTIEIVEGTAHDAISELLDSLNDHIDAVANQHPATQVTYSDVPTWLNGQTLDGATVVDDVQEAIAAILSDLAKQSSADDGGLRVGKYQSGNWHDGTSLATGSISSQIDTIVSGLASVTGNGGGDKVGVAAQSDGLEAVTAGSIYDQVGELLSAIRAVTENSSLVSSSNYERSVSVMPASGVASSVAMLPTQLFVVVGTNAGAGQIRTARNPFGTYTTRATGGTPTALYGVTTAFNLYIAVGADGVNGAAIETSPNATSWTARTPTGMLTNGDLLRDITYDPIKPQLVAVGDRSGSNGNILVSSNGTSWVVASTVPAMNTIYAIATDGSGVMIAVGQNTSSDAAVLRSTNGGSDWTQVMTDTAVSAFRAVAYDPKSDRWFVTGDSQWRSAIGDPTTWEQISSSYLATKNVSLVSDGKGAIIYAGGSPGEIGITVDGGETFNYSIIEDATGFPNLSGTNKAKYIGGYIWLLDNAAVDAFISLANQPFYSETISYP